MIKAKFQIKFSEQRLRKQLAIFISRKQDEIGERFVEERRGNEGANSRMTKTKRNLGLSDESLSVSGSVQGSLKVQWGILLISNNWIVTKGRIIRMFGLIQIRQVWEYLICRG